MKTNRGLRKTLRVEISYLSGCFLIVIIIIVVILIIIVIIIPVIILAMITIINGIIFLTNQMTINTTVIIFIITSPDAYAASVLASHLFYSLAGKILFNFSPKEVARPKSGIVLVGILCFFSQILLILEFNCLCLPPIRPPISLTAMRR